MLRSQGQSEHEVQLNLFLFSDNKRHFISPFSKAAVFKLLFFLILKHCRRLGRIYVDGL